jgi:transmembrane sensor
MKKEKFHQLLAKKLSGTLSDVEAVELQQCMSNEAVYERVDDKFTAYFRQTEKQETNAAMLSQIWEKINKDDKDAVKFDTGLGDKKPFRLGFLKIAAALFLIARLAVIAYQLTHRSTTKFVVASTVNYKGLQILADGTKVWLNQQSEIRYNEGFGRDSREIFLKGEAYFEVIKNQKVPLVVHAGAIDIKVKGTSFNVNATDEKKEIQVLLVNGLIEVAKKQGSKSVVLHPNQKLIFSPYPTAQKNQFVVLAIPAASLLKEVKWKNDTLHFDNEKLQDLALKLEKKYAVKININSAQLKEKRFSGTFTNETLQQVLEALKLSYPLTYTINNKLVIIKD